MTFRSTLQTAAPLAAVLLAALAQCASGFVAAPLCAVRSSRSFMSNRGPGGSRGQGGGLVAATMSGRSGPQPFDRATAKRAGRLGKMVMVELSQVLRSPYEIKVSGGADAGDIGARVASLVSVVEVEMAGDNKVAKVLVSAVGTDAEKKACVTWLQSNARAIRFSLAARMKHLKTVPELRFAAANLPQAMSVMSLLDELRLQREAKNGPAVDDAAGGAVEGEAVLDLADSETFSEELVASA
eukprot:CAMPEP_0180161644 /NCGR_PEP_ID=MMETSP0986-20121125/28781_1 /TAXON_ID=697907 /ORGANISM="non described non described, Strain CCMP2293" /LENGTH=240 /DNA_ID=CAMNT_0022112037 /DNA_START=34 /DNA_END=756 /DNA_ORIENTATION=+